VSGVRRVIVGASASPGCLPALRYAADVARRDQAVLVAVHAWTPPGGELAERRYPSSFLRKVWADAAADRLETALETAWGSAPAEVELQPMVVRGETGTVLVRVADGDDDLLVVGAGQRGRLARLNHGHIARYCMAHAQCPVLAVPPAALAGQRLRPWPLRRWEPAMRQAPGERADVPYGRDVP
jgi:nucleotide-binding universal stress UspA family protein